MAESLKIGIDYHGVITANPRFFKEFNALAIAQGIEIYVLSGGFEIDITDFLRQEQIPYTYIWSLADYFDKNKQLTYLPDGSFKVDDRLWNKAKADFCKQNGINFHIDDSVLYGEHFTTPFCLYDVKNKSCCLRDNKHCCIDFDKSANEVLSQILSIINV
jgi:hypothetical protein